MHLFTNHGYSEAYPKYDDVVLQEVIYPYESSS